LNQNRVGIPLSLRVGVTQNIGVVPNDVAAMPRAAWEHPAGMAVSPFMQVNEIGSFEALERLRPEWVALWERTPTAGPFQHPDWLLVWWRYLGHGELLVLTVRDRADLVAVAPFYIHAEAGKGVRQLTLLGNGISDTCDILLDEHVPASAPALIKGLLARQDYWNCYDFRDVPSGSALISKMALQLGGSIEEDAPCVVVALHDGWLAEGAGALARKFLADLRRCRRRAEELGRLYIGCAAPEEIADALDGLFRLHACRWRRLGTAGVLSRSDLETFHREVAQRFAKRRWLRLYRLYFGTRMAAANYGFCLRSRAYSYIGGFDPDLASLSPGRIIIHQAICDAAQEGAVEFDFLRGAEQYKYRWGGRTRPQHRLRSPSSFQKQLNERHAQ
jgi:CelD/BcsL family acetyltransferase involved in cellulose biosynthesis